MSDDNELRTPASQVAIGSPEEVTDEARARLKKRVDEIAEQFSRVADQKRRAELEAPTPRSNVLVGREHPDGMQVPPRGPAPKSRRALVVETSVLHRKVLVRALETSGFEVDALSSGEEALEAFQRCPYGIVLVDCDGAEADGFRTAASMRLIEGNERHTPIVGLTGNADQSHRLERKAAGIDNYLLKPFRRDRVEAVVARYAPVGEQQPAPQLLALDKDRIRELRELAGDDPAILQELIDLFLTDAPKLIDQMRRALEDQDGTALRRTAHVLKGSGGQIGALRVQDICATIETLVGTGSLAGVESLLSELSLAFTRCVGELQSVGNGELAQTESAIGADGAARRAAKEPAKSNDILVAEDDLLIARFLSSSLTAAGFHITHVRDGKAAMDAVHAKSFAAVLLDINMPEFDGYQVLADIRAQVGENTPVAIISSRNQEQDILRAFDLGVDDYLTKPFNPSEVVARIRRLVRQASAR